MNPSESGLTCPKCQGAMRAYERNGITIDQCGDCRGVFLDRGELERLIDIEGQRFDAATRSRPPGDEYGTRDHDSGHGSGHGSSQGKKRRGGFLSDLFE